MEFDTAGCEFRGDVSAVSETTSRLLKKLTGRGVINCFSREVTDPRGPFGAFAPSEGTGGGGGSIGDDGPGDGSSGPGAGRSGTGDSGAPSG